MWRVSTAGSSCLACCEVSVMKEGGRKEEEVACTAWLTRKYEREEGDRRNVHIVVVEGKSGEMVK